MKRDNYFAGDSLKYISEALKQCDELEKVVLAL